MLKAVIFDFDGIIVDTEPIHYRAFQTVLNPLGLGYSWEEYMDRYIGFDDRDAFREVFRNAGKDLNFYHLDCLIDQKATVFEDIVKGGVSAYAGAVKLIKSLSGSVPLALCSGALERDIRPILGQLGIDSAFDVFVSADDVHISKPDPESYSTTVLRLAAAFPDLGIVPNRCLAIEDTPAGIASATGAGLRVLAVTNSYGAEALAGAVGIIDSLESMNLETLRSIMELDTSGLEFIRDEKEGGW